MNLLILNENCWDDYLMLPFNHFNWKLCPLKKEFCMRVNVVAICLYYHCVKFTDRKP